VYSHASITGTTDQRYVIPVIPLSLMLFGFILNSIWNINFQITSMKWSKILSESFIGGFLIIMIIFFIILFYYSWPVQDSLEYGFFSRSPEEYAKKYPLDMEGLTENSVILGRVIKKAVEYNAIPFNPFWEYKGPIADGEKLEHISTLKKLWKKVMKYMHGNQNSGVKQVISNLLKNHQ